MARITGSRAYFAMEIRNLEKISTVINHFGSFLQRRGKRELDQDSFHGHLQCLLCNTFIASP